MEKEKFHPEPEAEPEKFPSPEEKVEEPEKDIYQISEELKQKCNEETELKYEKWGILNINPDDYGPPWTQSQARKFYKEEHRREKQLDEEGKEKLEALERHKSELMKERDRIAEKQEPLQKELISKCKTFEELIQTLQKIPTYWIGMKEILGTIGPWYYPTEYLTGNIRLVQKGESINRIPGDISGLKEKVAELLGGETLILREQVIKATNSAEYQEAIENDAGCVELSLKHTLSELRPDLDWDYSTVKEITGKKKDIAGTVPFRMLKELPRYNIEASYYTAIDPERFQQDGLEHVAEVFGENSRKEFAENYDIEQAQKDAVNIGPHIQHDKLSVEDLEGFLEQDKRIIVFVDAGEQYAELVKLGLTEEEHDPDAPIFHSIEVENIEKDQISIHDSMGLFPNQLSQEEFLKIWTIGPKAARETLVLNNK